MNNLEELANEIERWANENSIDIFKGYLSAIENPNYITIFWDEKRDNNVINYLTIGKNNNIKILHVKYEIYSISEFEELKGIYEELIRNKASSRDVKQTSRDILKNIDSLDDYDGKIYIVDIKYQIQNNIYCFNIESDWYPVYNMLSDLQEAINSEEEENLEEEEDE
jgi:hypothetical protein